MILISFKCFIKFFFLDRIFKTNQRFTSKFPMTTVTICQYNNDDSFYDDSSKNKVIYNYQRDLIVSMIYEK